MNLTRWRSAFTLTLLLMASVSYATPEQKLAFDGAMGFGKYTRGGNDGKLLVVTSTADNVDKPEQGTLRWAVQQKFPRLVAFAVSGVIQLEDTLEIKQPNITIAGQTSPGGIVVAGKSTIIEADQVIIRHMRFRPGHFLEEGDALFARNHSDIIIDHCSLSWANDEVGSFYNNTRFTLQNSILSESLNQAGHHKGNHGYGGIWGGRKASFIQNLLVSHTSRNPRINGWRLGSPYPQQEEFIDIRNNVIANWQDASGYGGEGGKANIIANVYQPGPATGPRHFFEFWGDERPLAQLFITGNQMKGNREMSANNIIGVSVQDINSRGDFAAEIKRKSLSQTPFMADAVATLKDKTLSPGQVWEALIVGGDVGANRQRHHRGHDSVDQRILRQITDNEFSVKQGIIDSELEVVNWEAYQQELTLKRSDEQPDEADFRDML